MDEETAGAIDALGSATTVGQLARLTQDAQRTAWSSMSARAWGNLEVLESIRRRLRAAFLMLGVLTIVIGLVELHASNQHHADTQASLARTKQAEANDLKELKIAEYKGRIKSAILACNRTNRRHKHAAREIRFDTRKAHAPAASDGPILQLIQAIVPYQSNCSAYAHAEIRAPKVKKPAGRSPSS